MRIVDDERPDADCVKESKLSKRNIHRRMAADQVKGASSPPTELEAILAPGAALIAPGEPNRELPLVAARS